jgi:hypothetical protein
MLALIPAQSWGVLTAVAAAAALIVTVLWTI